MLQKKKEKKEIHWTFWLSKPDFYAYIFVYMFVRLSINMAQTVIPFYMEEVLGYHHDELEGTPIEISIVLIISTMGSILNSAYIQQALESMISKNKKRVLMMLYSFIFVSCGTLPMFFLSHEFRYPLYFLAFIIGIGFSQGLATVSSLINDVVGCKGAQGAFVYGAYSFTDKLSCGIALAFFLPYAQNSKAALQYSMPFFPPATILCGLILVFMRKQCLDKNEKKAKEEEEEAKAREYEENKAKETTKKKFDEKRSRALTVKSGFVDDSMFTFISNTKDLNDA